MRKSSGSVLAVLALLGATTATLGTATPASSAGGADPTALARKALKANPVLARATPGQGFVVDETIVDPDGSTHVRMDRTFNGLPVIGGDLVVHQDPAGALEEVTQTLDEPVDLSTQASLSAGAATSVAAQSRPADVVRQNKQQRSSALVVDATGPEPRLAWEIVIAGLQADGTPSKLASYIDAATGQVIRQEQQITNADGTGNTLYSGQVRLQTTQAGGTYQLKDPTRGNSTVTDMFQQGDDWFWCTFLGWFCNPGTQVSATNNIFGTGVNTHRGSAAADAAYGAALTWDYFKNVHGRNGIWNNGVGALSRVHYGNRFVNAFWDGKKMTYGDGDGVEYGPLVSIDVAAHEMSHGVTQNTANLVYSGESGGLNEATSDIFAALVEFSANNPKDPGDYLIGEQFDLRNHLGFRRMDLPSTDGASADCWNSEVKGLDVHLSSGVGNHFFYLLAEGSGTKSFGGVTHTGSTCNGSTLTGIGRDAAGKIWYRALTVYMTSNTNYAGARQATIKAATDLYGANSPQTAAVAAAWSAVSVV